MKLKFIIKIIQKKLLIEILNINNLKLLRLNKIIVINIIKYIELIKIKKFFIKNILGILNNKFNSIKFFHEIFFCKLIIHKFIGYKFIFNINKIEKIKLNKLLLKFIQLNKIIIKIKFIEKKACIKKNLIILLINLIKFSVIKKLNNSINIQIKIQL